MPEDSPETADSTPRSAPAPTSPEVRGQRWQPPLAGPGPAAADFEAALGRELPIDRYVLAVERWAIAVRRLEAGVIDDEDREALLTRSDILEQFRRMPSRLPTPWVARLRRLLRRRPPGERGDSPPRPQAG